MTQLREIETWRDASIYFENLKKTVLGDIWPLLNVSGATPFAICREVLCYVDHLGHLYSGKNGPRQVGARFKDYLRQVMREIDPYYCKRAGEIYQMYRNGPVHQYAPKVLKNKNGLRLVWHCYNGRRSDNIEILGRNLRVTHLELVEHPRLDKTFCLPVSTVCLIMALVRSIDIFQRDGSENKRLTNWNRAACKLNSPECFEFEVT
jgi:hypothetical protein